MAPCSVCSLPFLIMPMLLEILLHMYFIWLLQLILLSIITPKMRMINSVYSYSIYVYVITSVSYTGTTAKGHCTCFLYSVRVY